MKKNIFAIVAIAITLFMASCNKEEIFPGSSVSLKTPKVTTTSDLIGTDWTANVQLNDLVYALTGMNISDYGCQLPEGFESTMVFHLNFDNEYAHFTFGENVSVINVTEFAGEYSMEEIEQMNLAYVYDAVTHTGTLTAVGSDENGEPINYQIVFTYDDDTDTITINQMFSNPEDENTTITFPMIFNRDGVNA